ncbi:3-hydroxyacyl-ACP dehydratase [Mucilaginibacter sp.]|uniref:3-hydroxyacyl-ACP dehydratase n=1 Tax=Mucilaginibacter sp. TaxID=1882438 RepID=UPI0035BBF35E
MVVYIPEPMQFPVDDITALIPQKHPFVFVNKLLEVSDSQTRSSFTIIDGGVFVKDGLFQEAGLMENIAQTAALRAGYIARQTDGPVKNGFIGNVKNFEVFSLPSVGDELITEVTIGEQVFDVTIIAGKVWFGAVLIASCEMKVFAGN